MKTITAAFVTTLLYIAPFFCTAGECETSPKLLSAYYEFSQQGTSLNRQNSQQLNTQKKQMYFELHRYKNRILQRDISQGIHDTWSLHNKRFSLSRAFEQYQHAIEYQADELRYQPKPQDLFQLVKTPTRDKMQLVAEKYAGCQYEQHFVLSDKEFDYQLIWLPKLNLVKYFASKNKYFTNQWQLTNYQADQKHITQLLNQYASFQSTDYADIGDNESISFLAAMINQGFTPAHHDHFIHNNHQH